MKVERAKLSWLERLYIPSILNAFSIDGMYRRSSQLSFARSTFMFVLYAIVHNTMAVRMMFAKLTGRNRFQPMFIN